MIKNKRSIISLLTALTLSVGLITPTKLVNATENQEELNELTTQIIEVLSFNDFHGNVLASGKNVGAATLTGVIKEYQAKDVEDDKYGVVTVSGGDMYQGTAISNILMGEPVNEMIKEIGIVASAIGNHEYDWGADKIKPWADDAGFKFVAANLIDEATGELPNYAQAYVMTEVDGVKIALVGIATPETLTSTKAENVVGLKFLDIVETLDKYSEIVRAEGADIVVALTHSPATENVDGTITGEAAEIGENAKDVDAVIAAHNHKFVDGFVTNNITGKQVPVVQAGYNGRGLSSVKFTLDDDKNIVDIEAKTRELYNEENLPVDANIETIINEYNEKLSPILAEKIVDLDFDLAHDRNEGITPLGVTIAEAIREAGGTQVAIVNGGGVRAPLSKGEITLGDMYTILPFDNNVVTMKVTGAKLKELIQHGIAPEGFGWGQYSGLTVWYDSATKEITSMRLSDGTKVKDDEYYTLTSIDFLMTGGDSYNFDGYIDDVIIGEMRDVVINNWKENGIKELNYNLLIDGEDTTIDTPSEEVKPEEKPEEKPEVKPETKPEVDSEVKPEQPSKDENVSAGKGDTLPNTGAPISSAQVVVMSLAMVGIGVTMFKKKEDIA
ncbi:5'-nucleotidase C-terminal domain-containing protein [Clostridium celatum]|uniref:5'-nucleotidase C-terminal domain-containing protein n=1 Tax=Clostridium celatum TaxID=36834 RepID=UPI0018983F6E|nr:5'-nucleotidase C-terminal domain-containing protein [Clostridium celatum]MCE9654331.1 5'-nucleotidase C-terminal domain-containing protein [Clostridium celatum]